MREAQDKREGSTWAAHESRPCCVMLRRAGHTGMPHTDPTFMVAPEVCYPAFIAVAAVLRLLFAFS